MSNYLYSNDTGPKIWAIGGGKGGVGKSLVTANTSICLALLGHRVAVIDLDLGGANLHTCLGVPIPDKTLSDFVTGQADSIESLMTDTPIDNLKIISGAQDSLGIANLQRTQQRNILKELQKLNVDYILFDLGAGTTINTLDFFINAHQGILVALPEPTSIENTYRFLKAAFYRKLKNIPESYQVKDLINDAMNAKISAANSSPADLLKEIQRLNPIVGEKITNEFKSFAPKLIMNQIRTQNDIEIGHSIETVCRKYFDVNLKFAGHLDFDSTVWQSVKKRKPLLMEFPESRLVNNFDRLVTNLI